MTMDPLNPDEVIGEAERQKQERTERAREALRWFLDNDRVGELYPRKDIVEELSGHLGTDVETSNVVIGSLVGDIVDPVQQVVSGGTKYVGIIEYRTFDEGGAYGYIDYDDRLGRRKRVVCARCVEQYELDEHITHATQGEGTSPSDASWQDLLNKVTAHYAEEHGQGPDEIEPGASLVSGTTVSGNTAWHAGNDGSGSNLDADSVDGQDSNQLGGTELGWNRRRVRNNSSATFSAGNTSSTVAGVGGPQQPDSRLHRIRGRIAAGLNSGETVNLTGSLTRDGNTLWSTSTTATVNNQGTDFVTLTNTRYTSNNDWAARCHHSGGNVTCPIYATVSVSVYY